MDGRAFIRSSNICNGSFHQAGMFKYLFSLQQKLEETPKRVQLTQNTQTEWRLLPYDRRGRKIDEENAENSEEEGEEVGVWGVRRGSYSHMWLLWLGSLQRSRLLHLHFSLKIAPMMIYLVAVFHPGLRSQDR